MNITYVNATASQAAGNGLAQRATCPANTVVVGGSCGYINLDTGLFHVKVSYSGIEGRSNYRCMVQNNGTVAGLVTYGAICTTASTVTGASAPATREPAPATGAIEC